MRHRIARPRATPDMQRIGRAVSYPGIDPREHAAVGVVEDVEESFRWDPSFGWAIDVQIYGGNLDGETDVVSRPTGLVSGPGGTFYPPRRGAEVAVLLPSGDAEVAPVVLGYLSNGNPNGLSAPPSSVTGRPIDGTVRVSTPVTVSPFDTEITVSPDNSRSQWAGVVVREGTQVVLTGTDLVDAVLIGSPNASQAAVKGDDYNAAIEANLDSLLTLLDTAASALSGLGVPALTSALAAYRATQLPLLRQQLASGLSMRVKVE